jgi:hypothetical protein
MKPGGKQLLMILWVLQMVTLHYLSSYRKFAGCARVLSFQLKDHQKNQEIIMRSLPGHSSFHIFPYLSYQVQSMPRPRNARGTTACQRHLAGSSIGSFNDGLRSAALGGSAFEDPQLQGEQREATGGFKVE